MIDTSVRQEFEDALRGRGIVVPPGGVIADGKFRRIDAEGKNGKSDAAYVLFSDPPIAGGFENWRDGLGWENWKSRSNGNGKGHSSAEDRQLRERWAAVRKAREEDKRKDQEKAAAIARKEWAAARPAPPDHPYLVQKKILAHDLRIDADGRLLIPMRDSAGELWNLQRIDQGGEKRFLPGGRAEGLFFTIGPDPDGTVIVAEGVSTALSIFEATGIPVVAAMSAGNLLAAGRELRKKLPKARLVYFADNDHPDRNGVNVGASKATEAANATGGIVVMSPTEGDDANDLYVREGAGAVQAAVDAAPAETTPEAEIIETAPRVRESLFEHVTVDKIIPPDGFLPDYIGYFGEQTDAPRLFHLMLGYVTVAAILGNRVYFTLAGDKLFPNIWAVVIGGSGAGRKSTSLNKSRGCVSAVDSKAIFPADFTTEALLDLLAVIPQGVFYHSEFRSLYGMLSKDYMSGAKALLTELYDSPAEYRRETKGKSILIKQPVISMASATTTQWLTSRNSEDDFGGGFLARFLFVPVFKRERSLALPDAPDPRRFSRLVQQLQRIREKYPIPVEARYTMAAREMYIDWYEKFDALEPFADTPLAPFHARYQAAVHKLAMLYTVTTGGAIGEMDMAAVVYATGTVDFITKSLLILYDRHLTFGKADEAMKKVTDLIPEKEAILRSELLKRSRMKMKDFDEIILTLLETDRITTETVKGKGRTGCAYRRKGGHG